MPCGCSKSKKYQVTTKAGETKVVDSLTSAMAIIRREGGRWEPIKVDR